MGTLSANVIDGSGVRTKCGPHGQQQLDDTDPWRFGIYNWLLG